MFYVTISIHRQYEYILLTQPSEPTVMFSSICLSKHKQNGGLSSASQTCICQGQLMSGLTHRWRRFTIWGSGANMFAHSFNNQDFSGFSSTDIVVYSGVSEFMFPI